MLEQGLCVFNYLLHEIIEYYFSFIPLEYVITTIFVPIVISVIASLLAVYANNKYKENKLTKQFSKFEGIYYHCYLNKNPIYLNDKQGNVTKTHSTTDIYSVNGNELLAHGKSPRYPLGWDGKILMDIRFPGYGFGLYKFRENNKSDEYIYGAHRIQEIEDGIIGVKILETNKKDDPQNILWIRNDVYDRLTR